jgi:CheY-like chemotaxis protein
LLVSLLSSQGYRIESVADGTLALRILEDDPEIDLVLTDLAMPGIPGTAVAEYLAHTRPEVKVVCMSGNPQPHEKSLKRLLERRLVDFLPKPFTPMQVLQLVKRLLDR